MSMGNELDAVIIGEDGTSCLKRAVWKYSLRRFMGRNQIIRMMQLGLAVMLGSKMAHNTCENTYFSECSV